MCVCSKPEMWSAELSSNKQVVWYVLRICIFSSSVKTNVLPHRVCVFMFLHERSSLISRADTRGRGIICMQAQRVCEWERSAVDHLEDDDEVLDMQYVTSQLSPVQLNTWNTFDMCCCCAAVLLSEKFVTSWICVFNVLVLLFVAQALSKWCLMNYFTFISYFGPGFNQNYCRAILKITWTFICRQRTNTVVAKAQWQK